VIVYVESNFVLEIALLQEEHEDCLRIIRLCKQGAARLVIPAFSLAEPYSTLYRRRKERLSLQEQLSREFNQLARTQTYRSQAPAMMAITTLLARSTKEEEDRLDAAIRRLLTVATVVPLTADTFNSAAQYQKQLHLSPFDAIVYASVLFHMNSHPREPKCFLNKNTKDFDDPDIESALTAARCKLLPRFDSGYQYIRSQVRTPRQPKTTGRGGTTKKRRD
jgi:predicted nucleic acid-binding protein